MLVVWVVSTTSGQQIRIATPGGGPARIVTTLAAGDQLLTFSHGSAFVQQGDGSLEIVNLRSSSAVIIPSVFPSSDYGGGGALDDSGQHMEYVVATDPTHVSLMEVDLSSHAVSTVASLNDHFIAPEVWHGTTLSGPRIVGFSDAPENTLIQADLGTGATLASTTVPYLGGYAVYVASDGTHGAAAIHSELGDDSDCPSGPYGPPGPKNTLQSFSIGGTRASLLAEGHHDISVLGGSPDFSTLLIADEPTAGGFAGITSSPDLGVFMVRRGTKIQLTPLGSVPAPCQSSYGGGTLYQDGATAAVSLTTGSGAELIQVASGSAPITLDTLAGGTGGTVALVPDL